MKFKIIETRQKVKEEETKLQKAGQRFADTIQSIANIGRILGMRTELLTTTMNLVSNILSPFKRKAAYRDNEKKVIDALIRGGGKFDSFVQERFDKIKKTPTIQKSFATTQRGMAATQDPTYIPESIEQDFYASVGLPKIKVDKIIDKLIKTFVKDRKKVIPGLLNMSFGDFNKYFHQYLGDYQRITSSPNSSRIEELIHKLRIQGVGATTMEDKKELARLLGEVGNQRISYADEDVDKLMASIVEFFKTTTSSVPLKK